MRWILRRMLTLCQSHTRGTRLSLAPGRSRPKSKMGLLQQPLVDVGNGSSGFYLFILILIFFCPSLSILFFIIILSCYVYMSSMHPSSHTLCFIMWFTYILLHS